jgi:hypothetical protein
VRGVVTVFILLGANAWAQDKATPASDDPIAGAKRDFEGVKATRSPSEAAKAGLPGLETPELSLTKPTPKLTGRTKTAAEILAEKKSANWLVDAMMKKDENSEKAEAVDPDAALLRELKLSPEVAARASAQKATEEKPSAKSELAKTGAEFNPLTRFMAGWMTPQDYSLLKPGMGGATADSLIARGETSISGPTGDLGPSAEKGGALEMMALSRPASLPTPGSAGNPFLQNFTPPPQGAANFVAPAASTAPVAPATVFTPPAEPPSAKSRMPDFAKPATDEKYFKQLKRF